MKRFFLLSLICGLFLSSIAQNITTEEFAVKDTCHLLMDIYTPTQAAPESGFPCIVYVFGGGFIKGSSKLAPRFEKSGYPYYFRRQKDQGHEVAASFLENVDLICHFYQLWVKENKNLQVDEMFNDKDHQPMGQNENLRLI